MDNKEQCRKLANRIYELDEKVYKTSGSGFRKDIYRGKGACAG